MISWIVNLILLIAKDMNGIDCLGFITVLVFIGMCLGKPIQVPLISYICSWVILLISGILKFISHIHGWFEWIGVIIGVAIIWFVISTIHEKIVDRRIEKYNFQVGVNQYNGAKQAAKTKAQRRAGFEAARRADQDRKNNF